MARTNRSTGSTASVRQGTVLVPEKNVFIESLEARWEGRYPGEPVRLAANPTIGQVPLPTRPTLAIGEMYGRIKDPEEYQRANLSGREALG